MHVCNHYSSCITSCCQLLLTPDLELHLKAHYVHVNHSHAKPTLIDLKSGVAFIGPSCPSPRRASNAPKLACSRSKLPELCPSSYRQFRLHKGSLASQPSDPSGCCGIKLTSQRGPINWPQDLYALGFTISTDYLKARFGGARGAHRESPGVHCRTYWPF